MQYQEVFQDTTFYSNYKKCHTQVKKLSILLLKNPLLGRLLDEKLIEETENGKYQITNKGKTTFEDLESFNHNMKKQMDTMMKMANVGKFMAMDVLERVTILGNLLS